MYGEYTHKLCPNGSKSDALANYGDDELTPFMFGENPNSEYDMLDSTFYV